MTPFLTPSKIGLLALIELYTGDNVPITSSIPILSFILNQVLPRISQSQSNFEVPLRRLPFILDVKAFQTLLTTHASISGIPGHTLWDHFLWKIWDIDSLDGLYVFFDRQKFLLAKTRQELKEDAKYGLPTPAPDVILLSRTSPLGTFIRTTQVELESLRFTDAVSLWVALKSWREETRTYWAGRSGGLRRWGGDSALLKGQDEWGVEETEMLELVVFGDSSLEATSKGFVSSDDVEKLLEFQVEQMQKLGRRIPPDVKDKFRSLLDQSFITPSLIYYMNFLDAWRSGDYPTSVENLHRYYDYSMLDKDGLCYQYALLNTAVLESDFGCFDEALAAMLETVSTARENQDKPCLNFALNWLYHFGKAHPNIINAAESNNMLGVEREGLAFLRVKVKESGMWTLWSSSFLSEAKLGMANGESMATAFENTLKSSYLIVEKNMKSMMGPQMAMQSMIWGRLGVLPLARHFCEIYLSLHARYGVFEDTLRLSCRIAHFLSQRGHYDEAMEKIENLDENSLRSWKANQYWLKYRGILRLKRDLHRNNLDGADQLLSQLLHSSGSFDGDSDLSFEINILHVDYLIRRTDFSGALAKIEHMSSLMKEGGEDMNLWVKLLTMKALLQDKVGRPQKGFSVAVRAASIAWRARLIPALWAAMAAVANILTSLGEFEASSQILASITPRALECEDCSLNAQLYSFLVDAHMGMAGLADARSSNRTENLTKCLKFIDRAFSEYSAVEDINGQCEMTAKKATIMRVLGDNDQANDYASAYLDLKKKAALAAA